MPRRSVRRDRSLQRLPSAFVGPGASFAPKRLAASSCSMPSVSDRANVRSAILFGPLRPSFRILEEVALARLTDFSYAAHAGSNTFLLDDDGICRRILSRGKNRASTNKSTQRCLGAQYVASLDFSSETGLVERPKEGCPLLFARVDEAGRVSLVRTAPLERFEEIKHPEREPEINEHPSFESIDPDELPPITLRAEAIAPATRREPREPREPRETRVDSRRLVKAGLPNLQGQLLQSPRNVDIDYLDPLDRTQQRPAVDADRLPPFDDDDDNDATIVGERPPELRKRGMLPKGGSEPLVPKAAPPSSGRKSGR